MMCEVRMVVALVGGGVSGAGHGLFLDLGTVWPGYCVTWVVCSLCENSSSYSLGICVLSCRIWTSVKSPDKLNLYVCRCFLYCFSLIPGLRNRRVIWNRPLKCWLDWSQVLTDHYVTSTQSSQLKLGHRLLLLPASCSQREWTSMLW